jgi:hypothetical protein
MVNVTAIVFCVKKNLKFIHLNIKKSKIFIENKDASTVGLLLTYALNLDSDVNQIVSYFSNWEGLLISFERCLVYTE